MKIISKFKVSFLTVLTVTLFGINTTSNACGMFENKVSAAYNTKEDIVYCGTPGNFHCCTPKAPQQ